MQTIRLVIDKPLLRATDSAVRKLGLNRSQLIRKALRAHLRAMELREKEDRDRRGCEKLPLTEEEFGAWDEVAAWPEE